MIFVLLSKLISLFFELLESQLISLVLSHIESLTHSSASLTTLCFGQSGKEIVLIVYKKLSLYGGIFLWRQIVLGEVRMIAVSHS